MTITTGSVALHTTPTGAKAFFRHYVHKRKRKHTPRSQLAYDEGIAIVRRFLEYASRNTLSELQAFTASRIPSPKWVSVHTDTVSESVVDEAASVLGAQLERDGIDVVGGKAWWQLRGRALTGEWIEMRRDKKERGSKAPERVLLYLHGGAYFFSSLETHRYQIQRHARKLKGVAFAPSYRLAPQYPFPCALQDALAAYLWLIRPPSTAAHAPVPPSNIIISGDSAGAGLALSLLVILRDQNIPMPAGASLISPWVDLTHSFPSILRPDAKKTDYIPNDGFHYKPDLAWPPLRRPEEAVRCEDDPDTVLADQIQLYCPNTLLTHPLVSPVHQGSLDGLCPVLITGGSGELLADEITYIAHKMADPVSFPPPQATSDRYPSQREAYERAKSDPTQRTRMHLAMFDDCCHVATTLSITKPAKYMYRKVASFNLWALDDARSRSSIDEAEGATLVARSGNQSQDHSPAASSPSPSTPVTNASRDTSIDPVKWKGKAATGAPLTKVTVTAKEGPHADGTMRRERITFDGYLRPMEPISDVRALAVERDSIGQIRKEGGPIGTWLAKRAKWDERYAKELKRVSKIKADDYERSKSEGYFWQGAGSTTREAKAVMRRDGPPSCAVASCADATLAKEMAKSVDAVAKKGTNAALVVWSKISAIPDEEVMAQADDKK